MENQKEIIPMSQVLDFSDVPSWYVLCNIGLCPLQSSCLRYLAGSCAPETVEIATCVVTDHSRQNSRTGSRTSSRVTAMIGRYPMTVTSRVMSITTWLCPTHKIVDGISGE